MDAVRGPRIADRYQGIVAAQLDALAQAVRIGIVVDHAPVAEHHPLADVGVEILAGQLAYAEESLEAPAGEVTFDFDNPASLEHDFVIEDADGNEVARTDVINADSTTTNADLEPGEYTFYCSVTGHREAGMEGPLTVE